MTIGRRTEVDITSLTHVTASIARPEAGVVYKLALLNSNGSVALILGTFNDGSIDADVDASGLAYGVYYLSLITE